MGKQETSAMVCPADGGFGYEMASGVLLQLSLISGFNYEINTGNKSRTKYPSSEVVLLRK